MTTTKLTADTVTDAQIVELMDGACAAQDWLQAALCERSIYALAENSPGAQFFDRIPQDKVTWLLSLTAGEARERCAGAINARSLRLQTTLRGWAAVRYAEATGVPLHRGEARRAHGVVEPARVVGVPEARKLLQETQTDSGLISCTATHGERPYRGSGSVQIDWPAIHAAALVVDRERGSAVDRVPLGYDAPVDAFGGDYFPGAFEPDGISGVVKILEGAKSIRKAAWSAIHGAWRQADGRAQATRALRTALALDHLFRALSAVGVYTYAPATQICGVTGYAEQDTVGVTGLRWLVGVEVDSGSPTICEVRQFLAAASAH